MRALPKLGRRLFLLRSVALRRGRAIGLAGFLSAWTHPAAYPLEVFNLAEQPTTEGQAVVGFDGKDYNEDQGTLTQWLTGAAVAGESSREIKGWTVHIHASLWQQESIATGIALKLLEQQLTEIVEKVPPSAVAKLRAVPLWFSPAYPGVSPRAEYHPGADWLRANHRDPAMEKGVEFTDVPEFEREMNRMPNFTLHELAHAYHDRVLGFENAEIQAAYNHAKAGHRYDRVERRLGNGRPNTWERAYAMTNAQEYFAECTEAFYSRNDFFPFTREELREQDPGMFDLLVKLWGDPNRDRVAK